MTVAPQGRADDFRQIVRRELGRHGAGFELGHVEQIGDEPIEPLGFVDDRRQKLDFFAVGQFVGKVAQRAGRAEHRGQRRFQVVRNRGQQRGAQPLGFGGALDAIHVLDQLHALDRERALIHQRVEQPPLVGREQRARLVAVDADDADGAAAGMHRQKQALGAGQRIGAAAGGAIVLQRPFRRGEIGVVERILGRIAGFHRDRAVARQQQHDPHLQHQRGLIGRRPQHVVERAGAGELAAERMQRFDGAHARLRRHRLHARRAPRRGRR